MSFISQIDHESLHKYRCDANLKERIKSDTFPLHNFLIVQFMQKCVMRKTAFAVTLIILSRHLSELRHKRCKRGKKENIFRVIAM
jgi:hypothetical protein